MAYRLIILFLLTTELVYGFNYTDSVQTTFEKYAQNIERNKIPEQHLLMTDTLLEMANKENRTDQRLRAYELKLIHACTYNKDEFIDSLYTICVELCDSLNDKKRHLKNWGNLIRYYSSKGNTIGQALDELINYQKLAIQLNDKQAVMSSFYIIGSCYYSWSDYITALYHFEKSIQYGEQNELNIGFGTYHNVAACARLNGNYELSLKYQKKAMESYQSLARSDEDYMLLLTGLLRDYIAISDSVGSNVVENIFHEIQQEIVKHPPLRVYHQRRYNDAMFFYYSDFKKEPFVAKKYLNDGKYLMANLNNAKAYYATKEYKLAADNYKEALEKIRITQSNQIGYQLKKYLEQYDYEVIKGAIHKEELETTHRQLEAAKEKALLTKQRKSWQLAFFILFIVVAATAFILILRKHIKKERRLKAEKEKAEHTEQLKSLFLQNMSHEIRTPLSAIVGFNHILHENSGDTLNENERKEIIQMIETNVELLQTLVSDVLDMSKFESGTYNVKITEIDPEHLCATIIESVRGKNKPDVELKYACHPKGITIRTDAQRLQQVLINFMTNACKYTEMGSITLGYELRDNSILFSVSDTGVGINSKDAENIFLRFSMLEKSVTGTGLGLHICKLISNMLGGKVYLDTTYKEGARFIFKIPLTT